MRAAVLLALLVTSSTLAGCIDRAELEDRWEDLDVQPRFTTSVLLNQTEPFSLASAVDPGDPPQDPGAVGDRFETTFEVPAGTRTMQILFVVNFTSLPSPPDPLPQPGLPAGDIRIFALNPEGNELNVTMEGGGSGGFDVRGPVPGSWTVGFRARGEGQVSFLVTAVVPVARAPANATLAP